MTYGQQHSRLTFMPNVFLTKVLVLGNVSLFKHFKFLKMLVTLLYDTLICKTVTYWFKIDTKVLVTTIIITYYCFHNIIESGNLEDFHWLITYFHVILLTVIVINFLFIIPHRYTCSLLLFSRYYFHTWHLLKSKISVMFQLESLVFKKNILG